MKTNQIMIRQDLIEQRTSDSFFNATLTLRKWNDENVAKKGQDKRMTSYSTGKATVEFIEYLKNNEGIKEPLISSRKGTWMHPLLYIDFCMWISVSFKHMALSFVLDGLIKTRHCAGDYYKEMIATITDNYILYKGCKPAPMIYINEARMIKEIAGLKDKNRNEMSETELSKITILQKVNSTLINDKVGKKSRIKQLQMVSKSLELAPNISNTPIL